MSFRFAAPVLVTPFSLRSHHRMNLQLGRIEVRLERIWCSYFPSKKFFTPRWTFDEPCRWTLLHILWWMSGWHIQHVCLQLARNCSKIWPKMGSFWTRQHMAQLEAPHWQPQIPYLCYCVSIYWPISKRRSHHHAGTPRVQFSRRLSSHGWHAPA